MTPARKPLAMKIAPGRPWRLRLAGLCAGLLFVGGSQAESRVDNEKKADLQQALPANPARPGTIRSGDLMLYGANTVVLFYLTFDSPYSYTRLGRVDDLNGLAATLGRRDVRVGFARD